MNIDEIVDNFSIMDDWEEKYAYLISLGDRLPQMEAMLRTDSAKVQGCLSQVWMLLGWDQQGRLNMQADSDAQIVRGLIAILHALFDGKTRAEAKDVDVEVFFAKLGMDQHLSPNRRNGFFSMVERIDGFISQQT